MMREKSPKPQVVMSLRWPEVEVYERIAEAAEAKGEPVSGYIRRVAEAQAQRDLKRLKAA